MEALAEEQERTGVVDSRRFVNALMGDDDPVVPGGAEVGGVADIPVVAEIPVVPEVGDAPEGAPEEHVEASQVEIGAPAGVVPICVIRNVCFCCWWFHGSCFFLVWCRFILNSDENHHQNHHQKLKQKFFSMYL